MPKNSTDNPAAESAERQYLADVRAGVHEAVAGAAEGVRLLDNDGGAFGRGIMVCTAHLAKGLEFDRVLVPQASATNYRTDMDRSLLYVACTRAMPHLTLTHTGNPTPFLDGGAAQRTPTVCAGGVPA